MHPYKPYLDGMQTTKQYLDSRQDKVVSTKSQHELAIRLFRKKINFDDIFCIWTQELEKLK